MSKVELQRAVVAALIATVVLACGDEAMHGVGHVMHDIGDAMIGEDGGVAMRDGGVRDASRPSTSDGAVKDAQAQPMPKADDVTESDCSLAIGTRSTLANGDVYEAVTYYADFEISGASDSEIAHASIVACDTESFGPAPTQTPCPSGATCENIGAYPSKDQRCQVFGPAFTGSKSRVYCGHKETQTVAGVKTVSGQRWKSVRLFLPQS